VKYLKKPNICYLIRYGVDHII